MAKYSSEIDAYIANSAEFAKPILNHLRELVHQTCPDVEEKMKWSFPHFDYKGMFCSMASFKHHCAFGFWKAPIMSDPHKLFQMEDAMGAMGKITSLNDLPSDTILTEYIREAMRLNDENKKLPGRPQPKEKQSLEVPDDLKEALKKNAEAQTHFDNFAYSHKKEYLEWITEAKRAETRASRIEKAVEMLSQGLSRNYKYEKK